MGLGSCRFCWDYCGGECKDALLDQARKDPEAARKHLADLEARVRKLRSALAPEPLRIPAGCLGCGRQVDRAHAEGCRYEGSRVVNVMQTRIPPVDTDPPMAVTGQLYRMREMVKLVDSEENLTRFGVDRQSVVRAISSNRTDQTWFRGPLQPDGTATTSGRNFYLSNTRFLELFEPYCAQIPGHAGWLLCPVHNREIMAEARELGRAQEHRRPIQKLQAALKTSAPSEKALRAAQGQMMLYQTHQASNADGVLAAAHDPKLGLDQSVCLRDVVEALRSWHGSTPFAEGQYAANFLEQHFGSPPDQT